MQIYGKNVYEVVESKVRQNVLIIYNISANHYVGLPIYNNDLDNGVYIKSINKYIIPKELKEYSRKHIKRFSICKRKLFKS